MTIVAPIERFVCRSEYLLVSLDYETALEVFFTRITTMIAEASTDYLLYEHACDLYIERITVANVGTFFVI